MTTLTPDDRFADASQWLLGLAGFGDTATPRVLAKRRNRLYGTSFSIALHLCIIIAMMWSGLMRPVGFALTSPGGGRPEAYDGRAMSVEIVSLATSLANGHDKTADPPADAGGGPSMPIKTRAADATGQLPAQDQTKPSDADNNAPDKGDQSATKPASPAAAAAANGQPNLPEQAQGGDPDGTQSLLRQIARCLPPGERPIIPLSKLYIVLDSSGALRLAPRMDQTLPFASKAVMKQADEVVQAALQCGPYKASVASNQMIALVPDFSFLSANTPPGAAAERQQ